MTIEFRLSKMIFGTMRLADGYSADPQDILKRIKHCLSLGITTFDLADIYGLYTYEALFGKALALEPSLRQKMEIVSKCDILYPCTERPGTVKHYDTSKEYILWSAENSLKNVGISYLDLLLIHRPDPLMNADEVAEAVIALKQSGKVRHFGVSNFTPSQFELLQSRLPFALVTNQIEFSVLHTEPLYDGTFDQLQRLRVQPMIWSPLAGGQIFKQEKTPQAQRVVDAMTKVAKELGEGVTLDQVAYAWVLRHPSNPTIVLGTSDLKRLESAQRATEITLTRPQWFAILEASQGKPCP
ncbi:NADP-dependent oxidoreductase domain-containing protein [Gorgonomyces haynaldii]|nr:NADP-dependent oxidoreductase domain-containing protein [Gorgonomyces haynaldii]